MKSLQPLRCSWSVEREKESTVVPQSSRNTFFLLVHDGSPSEGEKPGKRTTENCCARLRVGPRPQGCCHTAYGGNLRCHACMLMATSCVVQHCNTSLTVEQIREQVRTLSLLSAVQTHPANSERTARADQASPDVRPELGNNEV